jgi:hypothetical protein
MSYRSAYSEQSVLIRLTAENAAVKPARLMVHTLNFPAEICYNELIPFRWARVIGSVLMAGAAEWPQQWFIS